jgi:hypothetical protein
VSAPVTITESLGMSLRVHTWLSIWTSD